MSRAVVVQLLSVISGPAASVSPENLLEMPVLGPYPRPIESESLGPGKLFCNKSPRWFWWLPKSEKHCHRAGNRLISFTAATAAHSSLTVHRTGTYVTWEWAGTFGQERQAFLPLHLSQSLTFTEKTLRLKTSVSVGALAKGTQLVMVTGMAVCSPQFHFRVPSFHVLQEMWGAWIRVRRLLEVGSIGLRFGSHSSSAIFWVWPG